MARAVIESVEGADYFLLNGIKRPRSYEAIGVSLLDENQGVKIIPAHREGTPIQDTILFDNYEINGVEPSDQDECISLLNEIVFKKGGGNGTGVAETLIIPLLKMQVFKKKLPTDVDYQADQQVGDYCIGYVLNEIGGLEFIQADYLGGDKTKKVNYNI